MRILVTGGAGFLGQALTFRARAAGHELTTVDRGGDVDMRCDVADAAMLAAAMAKAGPEVVVHLAALLTDAAAADPSAAVRVNVAGTASVFTAARAAGARRVVYASSVAAVGPCAEGSGDDVALRPQTVYGATKAAGEHLARSLSALPGYPAFVVLRFGWVYGPGRKRGWRVAQEVVERFARGERRVRYPDFAEPIDWTYVDDAAEVLLRALTAPLPRHAVFNVVGDRRTIRDAVAHLQRRYPGVHAEPQPAIAPASGWGLRNEGLEAVLGFAPATRLEDGIDAMLAALGGDRAAAGGPLPAAGATAAWQRSPG
ncbi:MAG: NAD-dependent epimerase/dehydratase family protein [Casimicrobiaceae bacterium]